LPVPVTAIDGGLPATVSVNWNLPPRFPAAAGVNVTVIEQLAPGASDVLTTLSAAQQTSSFPSEDGGRVCAGLYGQGARSMDRAQAV
jgi:hypothetical protein